MITMTNERTGLVTFKGNPMTLIGPELKVGDQAPDFQVVGDGLKPVTLDSSKGKTRIFSVVPSVDTPVCAVQTKRFNEEAAKLGDNVVVYTISMDLPFAQKRFCGAEGTDKITAVSDFQAKSFGQNYGVLIKELGLLARSVFVIDPHDKIKYIQIVKEVAEYPDYDKAIAAAKA